ncbi:hypothetical protein AXF42_Ash019007 [Apostasia shenzhenica]|uniref:Pmr5/Cas1p GDSL/SGNH-like acyl-esterase family protein n=1 Tax=Apostasia shenzhenica TaxID=1088818 RepID=A0A2I0AC30_9ASPA|nr:hypothetical protein AXF42_Ash019007 [Apostasia shenzhenica]
MTAAQLGVLCACVVLFVPMGMAGWHLSRNKVLFFSGALFITLAVGVHIAPYFPAASHLIFPSLSPYYSSSPPFRSSSCLSFLHDVSFFPSHAPSSFDWLRFRSRPADCDFQKLSRSDVGELLNGSWIIVAGDSQARFFVLALLRLLLEPSSLEAIQGDLFRRHSDYHIHISDQGVKLDFLWSPFESNITSVLRQLRSVSRLPELLVAGSGLWHMLHVNNASDYGEALTSLRRSGASLVSPFSSGLVMQPPHMFWLGMPKLMNSMLNTEEKKERLTNVIWESYCQKVDYSGILTQSGGPFLLLDIGSLSRICGQKCTTDGMHYEGLVYETALQIMLNALLIESQQRI